MGRLVILKTKGRVVPRPFFNLSSESFSDAGEMMIAVSDGVVLEKELTGQRGVSVE